MEAHIIPEHRDGASQENLPRWCPLATQKPHLEVYFQILGRGIPSQQLRRVLTNTHIPLFLPLFLTFSMMLLPASAQTEYPTQKLLPHMV